MALDNAEFVDSSLASVVSQGFNTIRLKALSHLRVTAAYKKFLEELKMAKSKLAGAVAFAGPDGSILESEKKNILDKTTVIAKLEEQIKIMDREDIPHDFVKRRAIKLLDSWLANCRYNGQSAYSVGVENQDKLFAEEPSSESEDSLEEEPVALTGDDSTITAPVVDEVINGELDGITENSKIASEMEFNDVDEIADIEPPKQNDFKLPDYIFGDELPELPKSEEFDSNDDRAVIDEQLDAVGLETMKAYSPQIPARVKEFKDDPLEHSEPVVEAPLRADPIVPESRLPINRNNINLSDMNDIKPDKKGDNREEYEVVPANEEKASFVDTDSSSRGISLDDVDVESIMERWTKSQKALKESEQRKDLANGKLFAKVKEADEQIEKWEEIAVANNSAADAAEARTRAIAELLDDFGQKQNADDSGVKIR